MRKIKLKKNQRKTRREKKHKKLKSVLIKAIIGLSLLSLARTSTKYEIDSSREFMPDGSKEIDCSSSEWLTFYYIRLQKASSGKLISFELNAGYEGQNSEKVYLPIGNTRVFSYGLYNYGGGNCYVHEENDKNAYPLMVLVIQQSSSDPSTCKVVALITNRDLKPCGGLNNEPLVNILQPSGGAGTHDSFTRLTYHSDYLYPYVQPYVLKIKNLAVMDIENKMMEMLLLEPLTTPMHQEPLMLYTLDHQNAINSIQNTGDTAIDTENKQFMVEASASTYIPKIIQDDLPGFLFARSTQKWVGDQTTFQKIFQVKPPSTFNIHVEFYMEKPLNIELDKAYKVFVGTQPVRRISTQTQKNLYEQRFEILIVRTEAEFLCAFKRVDTGVITSSVTEIELPYSNTNSNFLYFSLTYGTGILYLTSKTEVKAKSRQTFSVYQPGGNRKTETTSSGSTMTIDQFFPVDQNQADTMHLLVNFQSVDPLTPTTDPRIRIYRASRTDGIYPAHTISSVSNSPTYPGCYLDGYKVGGCISLILLEGPDQPRMSLYSDSGTIKEIAGDSGFVSSCKVPYDDKICVIPMDGYVTKLEIQRPDKMSGNVMLLSDFNAWLQEEKDYYFQYTNDLSTVYLATCLTSCKKNNQFSKIIWRKREKILIFFIFQGGKCGQDLKCTECLDGSLPNPDGSCSTAACVSDCKLNRL